MRTKLLLLRPLVTARPAIAVATATKSCQLKLLNRSDALDRQRINRFEKRHGPAVSKGYLGTDVAQGDTTPEAHPRRNGLAFLDKEGLSDLDDIAPRRNGPFAVRDAAMPFLPGILGIAQRAAEQLCPEACLALESG